MSIKVLIPTVMQMLTNAQKTVEVQGSSVREVMSDLDNKYPGLSDRLLKGEQLHRYLNVFLNDDDVRFSGGLEMPVKSGDVITILPAVAGGSY